MSNVIAKGISSTLKVAEKEVVRANIGAINTKKYTSSAQTITSGALITLAHGLTDENGDPVRPFGVSAFGECLTNDAGSVIGDIIELSLVNNSSSDVSRVNTITIDDVNIYIRLSENPSVFVGSTGTGAPIGLTNSSWSLYIRAWY